MTFISSQELYRRLLDSNLTEKEGKITFDFSNIKVIVNDKSAIGNLFQEWLGSWMSENNIDFRINENTQEFPDFFLDENSNEAHLLEVKVFDAKAGAAFDVANFDTYTRSLLTQSYKLNSDYLIFSYTLIDGVFKIENIWLKKIWEITGAMSKRPINLQVKQDVFINIRPVKWYSTRAKFTPFNSKIKFLESLDEAIQINPKETEWNKGTWLRDVKNNHGLD